MLIIDGDYPMAYGGVDLDRDLTLPIDQVRAATDRRALSEGWPDGETMATLPEMRKGGVAAALVKVVGRIRRPNSPIWGYRTGHGAYAAGQAHLAYYEVLGRRGRGARPCHLGRLRGAHAGVGRRRGLQRPARRIHHRDGGRGPDPVAGAGPRVVGARAARHKPLPLRRQHLLARHRHRHGGWALPARRGAPARDGRTRHDPGCDPHF